MTRQKRVIRWLQASSEQNGGAAVHTAPWWRVVCLTGVDYFSTLCYQPTIAFAAAGGLAPLATIILALVTLFAALPVYCKVANESPHGKGSIAMLEGRLTGWYAKLCVLVLLGFAACAFIITVTLSASDGAAHFVENHIMHDALSPRSYMIIAFVLLAAYGLVEEYRKQILLMAVAVAAYALLDYFAESRMGVALVMVVALGLLFLKGLREVLGVAVLLVVGFISLSAIVVGVSLYHVYIHPEMVSGWWQKLLAANDFSISSMVYQCVIIFPLLALGLSGFETGVQVMPLIRGNEHDSEHHPAGRIANTKKLLLAAAMLMSVMLILSSLATTLLIDPRDMQPGGNADGRALSVLAHRFLGHQFGTVFDSLTIAILWFAGASALTGLLNLVRYLPRYGMVPQWAHADRPMIIVFTTIAIVVTVIFKADVMAQGGAYATGVLVLITSAAIAAAWCSYGKSKWYCGFYGSVAVVFLYTTGANVIGHPDGPKIAFFFILLVLVTSVLSRIARLLELRIKKVELSPEAAIFVSDAIQASQKGVVHLVAHKFGGTPYTVREEEVRERHGVPEGEHLLFLEIEVDDASDFEEESIYITATEHEGPHATHRILRCQCLSVAHAIAAILLYIRKEYQVQCAAHIGWTTQGPLRGSITFAIFGSGETGVLVRKIIEAAEPNNRKRPLVLVC